MTALIRQSERYRNNRRLHIVSRCEAASKFSMVRTVTQMLEGIAVCEPKLSKRSIAVANYHHLLESYCGRSQMAVKKQASAHLLCLKFRSLTKLVISTVYIPSRARTFLDVLCFFISFKRKPQCQHPSWSACSLLCLGRRWYLYVQQRFPCHSFAPRVHAATCSPSPAR